jgi:hypothetical protein
MRPQHGKNLLYDHFTLAELHGLCKQLQVEYEDLRGDTRQQKSLALFEHLDQRGRLLELFEALEQERPHLDLAPCFHELIAQQFNGDAAMQKLFDALGLPLRHFQRREHLAWGSKEWAQDKARKLQSYFYEQGEWARLLQTVAAQSRPTLPLETVERLFALEPVSAAVKAADSLSATAAAQVERQAATITHIAKQIIIQGDAQMSGDTFNMSGNFSGAILNIKSTLGNVIQTTNNLPNASDEERQELQKLILDLQAELSQAPPEMAKEAEAVAQTAKALVDTANAEQPNSTLIQISGEGLKKAAENLAAVMPTVLTIATQIVTAVSRLTG